MQGLRKSYGSVRALQDLTLSVPAGSVYGLLGPNGSGKTTTLGIVLDVLRADAGNFQWFGQPSSGATKRRIGALLETPNFYPYLSGYQNLAMTALVKGVPEADVQRVLSLTGLEQRQQSSFKGYSLGMKQRLALAATLLGNPEVLVLDEPTNGLDPQGIAEVRELIARIAAEGKTIVLASHLLGEVEKVCTHVAVLHKGQLKASGTVADILTTEDTVLLRADDADALQQALAALLPQATQRRNRDEIQLTLPAEVSPALLNRRLHERGIVLSQLVVHRKSLETQFLQIINQAS